MKIALVIEQMDPAEGGREVSASQIAAGLARRDQQVTVLCQRSAWRCEGVEVAALGSRGLTRLQRFLNFCAAVREAARLGGFDVIHAVTPILPPAGPCAVVYQPRGGTFPGNAAARLRRGGGAALHERFLGRFNALRRGMTEMERQLVADPRVICLGVSEMVAEEFRQYYGRREGVHTIHNGVDVPAVSDEQRASWRAEHRAALGVSDKDMVFLTIAKNFSLKGVEEAMQHFLFWCKRHPGAGRARLVVVGKAMMQVPHRSARVREVMDRIRMVGWTPDIFSWYSAADAVLLLSWYDACSRVVLEATRWGVPCITTAYNGAAEVISRGAGLVAASPRDEEGILRAMDALADPPRRAACAEACRALSPELSMDRHVEQLIELYARTKGVSG